MIQPDLLAICQIMLMTEGFLDAKELAQKFTILYSQIKQHISQQNYYDCGLRAINSMLVQAGVGQYGEITEGFDILRKILEESLQQYNDANAAIDLAFFEDVVNHIVLVSRIKDLQFKTENRMDQTVNAINEAVLESEYIMNNKTIFFILQIGIKIKRNKNEKKNNNRNKKKKNQRRNQLDSSLDTQEQLLLSQVDEDQGRERKPEKPHGIWKPSGTDSLSIPQGSIALKGISERQTLARSVRF
ncbi:MAG: hypothetical protein EZS28_019351 [Streblomastix strix]|uniref:Dynein heavy chain hydrolytic ATP-binding dynein motor region domain-containing protein n=1 Tax=Streblomastix strix TaxID=222440 RepID=A0A5J4VRV1_9EUKA|nr:MAG: hypothetical protein EZS28_019351 [Streblomastix strix]